MTIIFLVASFLVGVVTGMLVMRNNYQKSLKVIERLDKELNAVKLFYAGRKK